MEICINELIPEDITNEIENDYTFLERIDSGAFGTVMHAIETSTNRECAIKIINKSGKKPSYINKMKEEVTILKKLKHKNIVEFFGYLETKTKLYIMMELLPFGTLKNWMENNKEINEETASVIINQLLSAVSYLHSFEICHRDIKPENVMFSEKDDINSLKLIDFGLSVQNFYKLEKNDYCGTFIYMSPEQIEKKTYSKSVDIWSIGIIMFMLLFKNKHPFYKKGENRELYINDIHNRKKIKFPDKCSHMAKTLLNKLLEFNPSWRYTAEKALKHPWVTRRVNDIIPETFNEKLRKMDINLKAKELILSIIFLNTLAKKYNKKNIIYIKDDYCKQTNETSKLKRLKLEKIKLNGLKVNCSFDLIESPNNKKKNIKEEIPNIIKRNGKKLGSVKLPNKQSIIAQKKNTRLGSIQFSKYQLQKRKNFPVNFSPKIIINKNLNLPSVIPKKSKLTNIPYNQIKTEENENINKINTRNVQLRVPNLTSIKKKEFHNKEEAKIVPLIFPKINNNISQYKFK